MAKLWRNQRGEIGRQHVKAHSCSHFSPCFDHTSTTQTDDGTGQIDHDIGAYDKSVFQLLPLDARHFPDCLKHLQSSFDGKCLIQTVNGIYPAYSLWWVSWVFVKISFFISGNIIIKKITIEWTSDEFKSRAWKSSWMNFDGVSSVKFLDATLAWDGLSKASRMYIYFVPKYLNCVLINRRLSMILVQ